MPFGETKVVTSNDGDGTMQIDTDQVRTLAFMYFVSYVYKDGHKLG